VELLQGIEWSPISEPARFVVHLDADSKGFAVRVHTTEGYVVVEDELKLILSGATSSCCEPLETCGAFHG